MPLIAANYRQRAGSSPVAADDVEQVMESR
jgi:hypothetical protein